ncbi:MAG: hypothetical protein ACM3XM_08335 [Mycobacterium leprae]
MRRICLALLIAVVVAGCSVESPPRPEPAPTAAVPETPVAQAPPVQVAPVAPAPKVVKEGASLRLVGLPNVESVRWAPSGQTALVGGYRLRLDTLELTAVPPEGTGMHLGWSGPNEALLFHWDKDGTSIGELSLQTGEVRTLATVPSRHTVSLCQSGADWVWVEVQAVRQGGAGAREIGAVYRTPAPSPAIGSAPLALGGEKVMARGALLGRLADGSCLLDDLEQQLFLARPSGALEKIAQGFALPQITRDGRGVTWREGEEGECADCIELGSGVPFQRLAWWRLDGPKLTADLGKPQRMTVLQSPDGKRLIIGHRVTGEAGAAISVLSAAGFQRGEVRSPALEPLGWMGTDLLLHAAAPEGWTYGSPILRAADGAHVADWLTMSYDGSLVVRVNGEVRYLTPDGTSYRLANAEPFPATGGGITPVSEYQAGVPYVAVRQADGGLLIRLEAP